MIVHAWTQRMRPKSRHQADSSFMRPSYQNETSLGNDGTCAVVASAVEPQVVDVTVLVGAPVREGNRAASTASSDVLALLLDEVAVRETHPRVLVLQR